MSDRNRQPPAPSKKPLSTSEFEKTVSQLKKGMANVNPAKGTPAEVKHEPSKPLKKQTPEESRDFFMRFYKGLCDHIRSMGGKERPKKVTMNLQQLAEQARDHWKKANPEIYRQMVEDNALQAESEAAAKLTLREMETLMKGGMTEQEAWQESRSLFIFRSPEALEKAYRPEHRQ